MNNTSISYAEDGVRRRMGLRAANLLLGADQVEPKRSTDILADAEIATDTEYLMIPSAALYACRSLAAAGMLEAPGVVTRTGQPMYTLSAKGAAFIARHGARVRQLLTEPGLPHVVAVDNPVLAPAVKPGTIMHTLLGLCSMTAQTRVQLRDRLDARRLREGLRSPAPQPVTDRGIERDLERLVAAGLVDVSDVRNEGGRLCRGYTLNAAGEQMLDVLDLLKETA